MLYNLFRYLNVVTRNEEQLKYGKQLNIDENYYESNVYIGSSQNNWMSSFWGPHDRRGGYTDASLVADVTSDFFTWLDHSWLWRGRNRNFRREHRCAQLDAQADFWLSSLPNTRLLFTDYSAMCGHFLVALRLSTKALSQMQKVENVNVFGIGVYLFSHKWSLSFSSQLAS